MATDYIPSSHNEFNDFQINIITRATANAATWGIAAGKITALTAAQTVYQPFYDAIANPNDRTKARNTDHKNARHVYEGILRQFIKENLRYNSSITPGDKELLRINPGIGAGGSRPAISTAPFLLLKAPGGLQIQVECRVESDSSLPSIHPDADGLEIRTALSSRAPGGSSPVPPIPVPGDNPPPSGYEDATDVAFSSKARITKILPDSHLAGKYLYVFARWKNNSDEAKSGPWSLMAYIMIS